MTKKRITTLCKKFCNKYEFDGFIIDYEQELFFFLLDENKENIFRFNIRAFMRSKSKITYNWNKLQNRIDNYYIGKPLQMTIN